MSKPYINPASLGEPTKAKFVKKIYSGIYIHSHPFGGVEEADAVEVNFVIFNVVVAVALRSVLGLKRYGWFWG